MQKLILLFLLPFIFNFKLIGQNNDVVRCDKFTIDNNIFSTSNNYINAVETAINHIEFPSNVVVRNTDKLAEMSNQISEEKNMKSFGKTTINEPKISTATYSISCNAVKDAPNEKYTLKVEIIDILGSSVSKSISLSSIVFTKKEFEEISIFEAKLTKELDKEFAFDKILGLQKKNIFLENQKNDKQKVATIDSLNKKLAIMENNFAEINKKDAELEKLKHTKPEVQCHLILTEKGIDIEFNFSNKVPIEFLQRSNVSYDLDTIAKRCLSLHFAKKFDR